MCKGQAKNVIGWSYHATRNELLWWTAINDPGDALMVKGLNWLWVRWMKSAMLAFILKPSGRKKLELYYCLEMMKRSWFFNINMQESWREKVLAPQIRLTPLLVIQGWGSLWPMDFFLVGAQSKRCIFSIGGPQKMPTHAGHEMAGTQKWPEVVKYSEIVQMNFAIFEALSKQGTDLLKRSYMDFHPVAPVESLDRCTGFLCALKFGRTHCSKEDVFEGDRFINHGCSSPGASCFERTWAKFQLPEEQGSCPINRINVMCTTLGTIGGTFTSEGGWLFDSTYLRGMAQHLR